MDKYLKTFEPAMKQWLSEHYTPEEARARWERTVELDEKWIREEGDLGGRKNLMASNLLEAYAFFAFYEAVDRNFTKEDLGALIDAAMGKTMRMMARFDMNRLLKKKWLVRLIYRCVGSYARKADRHRGKDWGNTWKIRINPEGYTVPVQKTFKVKRVYYDDRGRRCEAEELVVGQDEVHVPANVNAQKFWLANRKPETWREKPVADGDNGADAVRVIIDV